MSSAKKHPATGGKLPAPAAAAAPSKGSKKEAAAAAAAAPASKGKDEAKKRMQERCGLVIPPARVREAIATRARGYKLESNVAIQVTAVIEFVLLDWMEMAMNHSEDMLIRSNKTAAEEAKEALAQGKRPKGPHDGGLPESVRVNAYTLQTAKDETLRLMFPERSSVVTGGGVLPMELHNRVVRRHNRKIEIAQEAKRKEAKKKEAKKKEDAKEKGKDKEKSGKGKEKEKEKEDAMETTEESAAAKKGKGKRAAADEEETSEKKSKKSKKGGDKEKKGKEKEKKKEKVSKKSKKSKKSGKEDPEEEETAAGSDTAQGEEGGAEQENISA